jgi:hypothetical protein
MWDLIFSATADAASELVCRTYGVMSRCRKVAFFDRQPHHLSGKPLEVKASASKGTVYNSLDGEHWSIGGIVSVNRTSRSISWRSTRMELRRQSSSGHSEKEVFESVTATALQHYLDKRIDLNEFLQLGQEVGYLTSITLYHIGLNLAKAKISAK